MKLKLKSLSVLIFATFIIFAFLETVFIPREKTEVAAKEDSSLEVPKTGSPETANRSETFESLVEISFLALVGVGFYILNEKEVLKR